MEQMDPVDAALIRRWGSGVSGPILDAGCGPGHWTDFLARGVRGPVAGY
ncbi:class I SAM-dependent methyltransferase [Haematomicrobium sanguinis]|nr:class I SAM-dependent methyltransferase [Haematomicrobium sanguinis]